MSKFTPYTIVPIPKKPAWATPDFNPNANYQVARNDNPYNGLSPQTQKGLIELDRSMQQKTQEALPISPQTMESAQGMIQLPNGQFVTPESYKKLLETLKNRK